MMRSLFTILAVTSAAGLYGQSAVAAEANFKKLSWLVGDWNRTNVRPNRSAGESWSATGNFELTGKGITLSGTDTAFVEKLKIVIRDNAVFYVADVPENKEPVYFRLTVITDKGFVCENPEHDFPKKIEYALEGNKLKATISGNGKAIDYHFERIR